MYPTEKGLTASLLAGCFCLVEKGMGMKSTRGNANSVFTEVCPFYMDPFTTTSLCWLVPQECFWSNTLSNRMPMLTTLQWVCSWKKIWVWTCPKSNNQAKPVGENPSVWTLTTSNVFLNCLWEACSAHMLTNFGQEEQLNIKWSSTCLFDGDVEWMRVIETRSNVWQRKMTLLELLEWSKQMDFNLIAPIFPCWQWWGCNQSEQNLRPKQWQMQHEMCQKKTNINSDVLFFWQGGFPKKKNTDKDDVTMKLICFAEFQMSHCNHLCHCNHLSRCNHQHALKNVFVFAVLQQRMTVLCTEEMLKKNVCFNKPTSMHTFSWRQNMQHFDSQNQPAQGWSDMPKHSCNFCSETARCDQEMDSSRLREIKKDRRERCCSVNVVFSAHLLWQLWMGPWNSMATNIVSLSSCLSPFCAASFQHRRNFFLHCAWLSIGLRCLTVVSACLSSRWKQGLDTGQDLMITFIWHVQTNKAQSVLDGKEAMAHAFHNMLDHWHDVLLSCPEKRCC